MAYKDVLGIPVRNNIFDEFGNNCTLNFIYTRQGNDKKQIDEHMKKIKEEWTKIACKLDPYYFPDYKFIYSGDRCIIINGNNKSIVTLQEDGKAGMPANRYTGFLYCMIKYIAYCQFELSVRFSKKDYSKVCSMNIRSNDILEGILIGLIGFDKFNEFKDIIMDKFYPAPEEE